MAPSASTYRDVLRLPHVGGLLGAAVLARLAEQMFTLPLVLHVLAVFHSPQLAGIAVFASAAPGLVVSPLAGALLDRFGAVRGIAADLLASAVLVAALALVAGGSGTGNAVLLVGLAALYSLSTPLSIAGVRTLMPRLVPAPELGRANALDISSYNLVEVLGPVLGGGVFALAGGQVALVVVAGLYAAAWVLLRRLPPGTGRTDRPAPSHLWGAAVAGVRYVLSHRLLRALVISYGLYQVAWGVLVVTVPTAAAGTAGGVREHGWSVGLLWGIVGFTGVVGAVLVGRVRIGGRERAAIVAGAVVTAIAAAPVMAVGGSAGLVGGLALVGLASGPINVGLLTLRQRRTDPGWLGRVLSISISLNVAGMPVGSAVGGYLVTRSPALAFTVAGVAALGGALAAWGLVPAESVPGTSNEGGPAA